VLYIVDTKATCHSTRQPSINARASIRYLSYNLVVKHVIL